MSIDPVPAIRPAPDSAIAGTVVRGGAASPDPRPARPPDSGSKSIEELHSAKLTSETSEIPQDEVQVQRTNGASGDIVIRYLDAQGNLIVQIPSAQVLGLARAVEHALEEQAGRQSSPDRDSLLNRGGTPDGD